MVRVLWMIGRMRTYGKKNVLEGTLAHISYALPLPIGWMKITTGDSMSRYARAGRPLESSLTLSLEPPIVGTFRPSIL